MSSSGCHSKVSLLGFKWIQKTFEKWKVNAEYSDHIKTCICVWLHRVVKIDGLFADKSWNFSWHTLPGYFCKPDWGKDVKVTGENTLIRVGFEGVGGGGIFCHLVANWLGFVFLEVNVCVLILWHLSITKLKNSHLIWLLPWGSSIRKKYIQGFTCTIKLAYWTDFGFKESLLSS